MTTPDDDSLLLLPAADVPEDDDAEPADAEVVNPDPSELS